MTLQQVEKLISEIGVKRHIKSFVILGSLSVYGLTEDTPPVEMTLSNEVDSYPEIYPALAFDIASDWGQGSEFERTHGYYFDPISPKLPTLPEGWEGRLISKTTSSGITMKFGDPNDVAISKYTRGEAKDRRWIRAGLQASILSLATIEYRCRTTPFLDQEEHEKVKRSIDQDKEWLASLRANH